MGERNRRAAANEVMIKKFVAAVESGQIQAYPNSPASSMTADEMAQAAIRMGQAATLLGQLAPGSTAFYAAQPSVSPSKLANAFARMDTPGSEILSRIVKVMSIHPSQRPLVRLFQAGPQTVCPEHIMADDRAYFAVDSARYVRIRHAYPEEFSFKTWPPGAAMRTAVISTLPDLGMRARMVYCCRPGSIESRSDHDQQTIARIFLELGGCD